jgi:hypothetical protein
MIAEIREASWGAPVFWKMGYGIAIAALFFINGTPFTITRLLFARLGCPRPERESS